MNPKENASAIILRSGKEIEPPAATSSKQEKEKDVVTEKNVPNDEDIPKRKFPPFSEYNPIPPFPQALAESRKMSRIKIYMRLFVDAR